MYPLRRVMDHEAGPSAVGILVPPSRRTFLILRPRSLSWDLLLLRSDAASAFHEMPHHQANALALVLFHGFVTGAGTVKGSVEEVAAADGPRFQVSVQARSFVLRVCERRPEQPYRPLLFADRDTAQAAVDRLLGILCPPEGVDQEVYLNTLHFAY